MASNRIDRRLLAVAWVVAAVATVGSLNYSLGMGLFPCRLCWYQRIFMYPLVIVLGVGLVAGRPEPPFWWWVLPFSVPGLGLAAYHSWLQVTPSTTCAFAACGRVQFRFLGVLSIPNQSLVAFLLLTAVAGGALVRARWSGPGGNRGSDPPDEEGEPDRPDAE